MLTLISRCIAGDATPSEWSALDKTLANDPATARRWVQESRLHHDLTILAGVPVARPRRNYLFPVTLAAVASLAAAAAAVMLLSLPPAPPASSPQTLTEHLSATPAAEPEPAPASPKIRYTSVLIRDKVVALTFEDGPVIPNTLRLLDVLKTEGVTATFFPTGANAEKNPELIRRMIADGHEVANHTWTHPMMSRIPDAKFREEIQRAQQLLGTLTGKAPVLWRPPYGAITEQQIDFVHREYGLTTILWSVDPEDWKDRDAAKTTARILKGAHPGGILLLHDIHRSSIDAVPGILKGLREAGYSFDTVSRLIARANAGLPPPKGK